VARVALMAFIVAAVASGCHSSRHGDFTVQQVEAGFAKANVPLDQVLGYGSHSSIRATLMGSVPLGGGRPNTVLVDVFRNEAFAKAFIRQRMHHRATYSRRNVVVSFSTRPSDSNRRAIRTALIDLGGGQHDGDTHSMGHPGDKPTYWTKYCIVTSTHTC
jgi:hypothetical protein